MLIDTHCHLNLKAFTDSYRDAIARAKENGVGTIVNSGTQAPTSKRAVEFAREFPRYCYATVAIHPHHAIAATAADFEKIESLSQAPEVIAIGETGLDYYREEDLSREEVKRRHDVQQELFLRHLTLAHERRLPVSIHSRNAYRELAELMTAHKSLLAADPPGVMHCFTGTVEEVKPFLDLGFFISFSGIVTFDDAEELKQVAKYVPLDQMVVETDAPFLAPEPMRGKKNEPAFVRYTAEHIAELRILSFQEFAEATTKNAYRLFHLEN
ncbi:MAG: TatD family hydrolase [Parcubacteria group bacterium]|nr:TatD family hydrolase [Parcubacteria group bacterium]